MKPLKLSYIICLLFVFLLMQLNVQAQLSLPTDSNNRKSVVDTEVNQWMKNASGLRFLENKGQMVDTHGNVNNNLLFKASRGGVDMYITGNGLSYVFTHFKKNKRTSLPRADEFRKPDSISEQYCRADMDLVGADIRSENIIKQGESENRTDYYLGGVCPNGIFNVHSYQKITIKNIYPGIDWVIYTGQSGLEYDFKVHPGADPSLIRLKYKWTDKPQMKSDGSIKIATPMGVVTEGVPISYEKENKKIQTTYVLNNNEIRFEIDKYNKNAMLTIDPSLVWSTYVAGDGEEDAYSVQSDGINVWVAGCSASTTFPALNPGGGSYCMGSNNFTQNVMVLKFSVAGVLKWATVYGGSGAAFGGDNAYSICVYKSNIWLTGYTYSSNFPTFNPGGGAYYQSTITKVPGGATSSCYILQFDTSCMLKWATYYGGSENEMGNSIQSDGNYVWVTGYTYSKNFPTLNPGGGAYYQAANNSPYQANSFILQFTTTGVSKWATYYGGNGVDEGYSIYSDGINAWVTGYTNSTTFNTLNPGSGAYYQGVTGTNVKAYILKFNMSGVLKWGTYYGGSGAEYSYVIQSNGSNVWVTGFTTSLNFPTQNPGGGAYFQGTSPSSPYGFYSVFILQFDTAGVRKWATYYGALGNQTPYSMQVDGNNVWIAGMTQLKNFPLFNPGCSFFQDTLGGAKLGDTVIDAFILQFSTSGVRKWATYYGTDREDDGVTITSDGTNVFIAGDAAYDGYPTVNPGGGAYYVDSALGIPGGGENAFIGKFCIACSTAPFISTNSHVDVCKGDSVLVTATGADTYSWSPSTGLSSTSIADPMASPNVTTTYTVNGILNGCPGVGKDSVTVTVDTAPIVTISNDDTICKGDSIQLTAGGGTSYMWSPATGLSISTGSVVIAKPTITTTYTVSVSNGKCSKDTSMKITVNALPTVTISGKLNICKGDTTTIAVNGGVNYTWSTGTTTSSISVYPVNTTTYTVNVGNGTCMKDTAITVVVNSPFAHISGTNPICAGSIDILTASGGTGYLWNTGATTSTISVTPVNTTTYTVKVGSGACIADTGIVVTVNTTPLAGISGVSPICAGSSSVIIASGGTSYIWSTGATSSSITVSPISITTYTVEVSNGLCVKDTSLVITVDNLSGAGIGTTSPIPICAGSSDMLIASGGGSYIWSTGATTSDIIVSPITASTYSVLITNGICKKDTSITISVTPIPSIHAFAYEDTICLGAWTALNVSGAGAYTWSPSIDLSSTNISNPTASPNSTSTYTVSGWINGCEGIDSVTIAVKNCESIYVPNVFTPNGDGKNDEFIVTIEGAQTYDIEIFNRWGEKEFESNSLASPWSGKSMSGATQADGVYYYVIKGTYFGGQSYYKEGFF